MLFYTVGQSAAFLLMLECGLRIGLAYDLLCALRRLFRPGFILSLFMDIAFGAAAAGLIFYSLLRALSGELRLYALMGALAGFLLYGATLSRLLRLIARRGLGLAGRVRSRLARSKIVEKLLR